MTRRIPQQREKIEQRQGVYVPFEPGRRVGHVVDDVTGCWIFSGSKDTHGYGKLSVDGHGKPARPAHRVYYERAAGRIPRGLTLDHLCRSRACVNPIHLEPVTNQVNVQRGRRTRLTVELVDQLNREYVLGGTSHAQLARRLGVSKSTISHALQGRKWRPSR